MEIFWTPLTLSEARGFVVSYTVSYRQLTSSSDTGQLEEQQETARRSDGTIVTGLQENATYLIQVWANTAAGAGERSSIVIVQPPTGATGEGEQTGLDNIGAIIGGVLSVLLIVAITIFAVVVVVSVARVLKGKQPENTTE